MATATKKKAKRGSRAAAGKTTKAVGQVTAKASKKAPAKPTPNRAARPARKRIKAPERAAPPMAEVDAEVLEFIAAIDVFKKQHGRPFPSWSEVLLIVRQLGYSRS